MKFLVADTLTGVIVGQLEPSAWSLSDPLRTPGTGSLTVPLPTGASAVARLADMTLPRKRWVALQDEQGRFLWAGPIPRRPARNGGQIVIPVSDWRSWFYRATVRPLPDGSRRNYIRTGREQGLIYTDLMALALDTDGGPRFAIDTAPTTGVTRDLTAMMLDRSIAENLDSIRARGGPDWFTYCTQDSPTTLLMHVAVGWPERRTRETVAAVSYKVGTGGNAHDYAWPEGQDAPTRVWALGEGEPPDQVFAGDFYPEILDGTEVAWETVLGPLDGVKTAGTAFDYAFEAVQRSRGYDGIAEFSILHERMPLGDLGTGDRVRVELSDGWDEADVPSARIVDRTISGGRDQPTQQRISVDLADNDYGDNPGFEVPDDQ